MKYANNWAWAGCKGFFYKLEVINKPTDITIAEMGFEYKAKSASNWTKVKVFDDDGYLRTVYNTSADTSSYAYMLRQTPNKPVMILIKNLSANTTYMARGYYKDSSGNETTFNSAEVTTITAPTSGVKCTAYNRKDSVSYSDYNSKYLPFVKKGIEDVVSMLNMTTNMNYDFTVTLYYANDGAAAWSDMTFNMKAMYPNDNVRSVALHEIAHNTFKLGYQSDKIMQFMEFATDCEGASWKVLSSHCYPIITSNRHLYIDDALICAAIQLSRT